MLLRFVSIGFLAGFGLGACGPGLQTSDRWVVLRADIADATVVVNGREGRWISSGEVLSVDIGA